MANNVLLKLFVPILLLFAGTYIPFPILLKHKVLLTYIFETIIFINVMFLFVKKKVIAVTHSLVRIANSFTSLKFLLLFLDVLSILLNLDVMISLLSME